MPQTLRSEIQRMIDSISPCDGEEEEHLTITKEWIESGAGIFRIAKPATPDPHLAAYLLRCIKKLTALKVLNEHN